MTIINLSPQEQAIQQRLDSLNVTNEHAQALLDLARNPSVPLLPDALTQLEESVRRAAALDIVPAISNSSMTGTQIRAVFFGAMLKRSRTIEYAAFELMYYLLRTIRDEALAQAHPANYTDVVGTNDRSFLAMAEAEAGIAPSVASDIMTLGEIILPYIEQELNTPRVQVWSTISQTNLRNMIPVLRVLVNRVRETGDTRQPSRRVEENATEVMNRWAATVEGVDIVPNNREMTRMTPEEQQNHLNQINENRRRVARRLEQMDPEERVRGSIEWLLENGQAMPTREFSQLVGGRSEDPFDALAYHNGSIVHMAATFTEEQWEHFQRIIRNRMTLQEANTLQDLLRTLGHGRA
jgi:hypothetical protein